MPRPRPALRQHPFRGTGSAVSAASCTPTSIAFCAPFSNRAADLPPCRVPHHPSGFIGFGRNAPFQRSVHFSSPVGRGLPLFQLRNHDSRHSVGKLNLLYTPFTWSTSLHVGGAWKVHHLIYLTGDVRRIPDRQRSGDRRGMLHRAVSRYPPQVIAGAAGPSCWSPATSSRDVTHPRFNRLFRGLMSSRRSSHGPADFIPPVWRCHCRPERTLSKSVHCLRPVGCHFPMFQIRNSLTWIFPTHVVSLYTPRTSRTAPIFADLIRVFR